MRYEENRACVELSVRELCTLALNHGDLEYGGSRAALNAMQLGAEIHRRLQSERTGIYHAEVALQASCVLGGICYTVNGRADGVEEDGQGLIVEEIKTMNAYRFYQPLPIEYLAQLKLYAYFLCAARNLDGIRMRMVCYCTDNEKIREKTEYATATSLRAYFMQLLQAVERWANLLVLHQTQERTKLRRLPFPYAYMREGQERMVRAVHRAINKQRRLFVQAPTGIGKTMSALYPAIRALGEETCDRIFYLTAKASTRREAFDAVRRLVQCGAGIRAVILTAREQICPQFPMARAGRGMSSYCNGIDCPYAAGYYDRAPDAVYELLIEGNGYNRTRILEVAEKYRVCPYELSLDVSEHCDVIIADYNYVFDPMVYLRRYFASEAVAAGKNVFLVDEAHNLADRARDMYSAQFQCSMLEGLREKVDPRDRVLLEGFDTLITSMRGLRIYCRDNLTRDEHGNDRGFYLSHAPIVSINEKFAWLRDRCEGWLKEHREEEIAPAIGDLCYSLREYFCILEHYDEHYLTYVMLEGGDVTVRLFCLDPSQVLDVALGRSVSATLFSATLTPLTYFMDLLGGGEGADHLALSSPFDRDQFGLFAIESISTRFEQRNDSYAAIASCIAAAVSGRRGNYIVYFPSYSYMESVWKVFHSCYPKVQTVVQKKGMKASEKETFLDAFAADSGVLRVGFCVLGGSFSEGVDLPGTRLIGSVIVGVGLPGLSNERNILQEYYQNRCEMGYEYAYLYPGMNHVLQAAGRVIRREEDVGIVVLIDDRYASPSYTQLFPAHWHHLKYAGNAGILAEEIRYFWDGQRDLTEKF